MSGDVTATFTVQHRILVIAAAYRAAQENGQPFDLEALLARQPDVADAVRAHLGLAAPEVPADQRATFSAILGPATPGAWGHETLPRQPLGPGVPTGPGDFGDYELLEEVARGGMGVVFRAREKSLNRIVALKMILAGRLASIDQVRRFHLEAEEASHLDHPNIVPIYHIGEHLGQHYFTMKFIEEGPLTTRDRGPGADLRKVARLLADVAGAVHYAHQHGVLHRDLKPGKILIDREGRPHVTDFGLAKHVTGPETQTQSGAVLGTPGYISPEQAGARRDLSTATDVYSLGAVLYDLITGRPPFLGSSAMETLVRVMEDEPAPPRRLNPRLDRDLETICLTCLNKDPRRRYASADALARDLGRYLAGEPILARRIGRLERAGKWIRRRPLAAALVVVLGLATVLLTVGGWLFSVRLQAAVRTAQKAQAAAEQGEQDAEQKRRQLNDYLVYLNERLANLRVEQPVRLEFLNEGLALCERFRKGRSEDPETRRQTAQLYRCLGDLESERTNNEKASLAYSRARELLEQLDEEFPAAGVYRNDLAVLYAKQADFLSASGEPDQALATLRRAIEVQDRLAEESSAPLSYQQRAAEFRVTLGTFLEEQNRPDEAEAAYRAALERLTKLAADRAAPPGTHQRLAGTASTLAWLLVERRPEEAESLLQQSLRELREARNNQPDSRELSQALWGGYVDLAAYFKQRSRHAELAALANQVRGDYATGLEQSYGAARFLTDAVRVAAAQQALPPPERDALTEEYAAAAVAMLDRAIKEGFGDRARIEVDPDLDPLRQRQDFAALMTELERRYPNLSPERELTGLQNLFDNARRLYQYQTNGARTRAEFQRARAVKPDLHAYAEKFLQLAQKRRDSATGMEALVRLLETCEVDEVGPAAAEIRLQAAQMLAQDHLQRPEFGGVCMRFARLRVPEAEDLLREAMKKHPQREVRGLAGLTVATGLARAGNEARASDPARADTLMREAEQELARLLGDYGNVPVGRSTLGEIARHELDEVRYLSVGSSARDIVGEDLNGRALKLSDFRGKVVVLDFWADWCGFCRQMYPQEQDLVQRYKGKPFALLGVNCDDDRDAIRSTVKRRGLGWDSWWDGGAEGHRIRRDWHVGGFPTIWVLDHRHVIRARGPRGKELDAEVARLVKEAEEDQARSK
jgi:thiol-disulfide isomerase/thioredoxin